MKEAVKSHARDPFRADVWDQLAAGIRYVSTDFADERGEDGSATRSRSSTRSAARQGNRLHYLAVPPQAFRA